MHEQMYGDGTCGLRLCDAVEFFGVLSEVDVPIATEPVDPASLLTQALLAGDAIAELEPAVAFTSIVKLHCIGE